MSSFTAFDGQMMSRALHLAKRGIYTSTPNPNVGCVIVSDSGQIVGEGWHVKAGSAHAEVNALQDAGELAKDATAYVTLEPCSHHGRTPPCCHALAEAGVKRVVAAMVDPNPLVAGQGLDYLEKKGVIVSSGLMAAESETLNPGYCKRMRTGLPRVTVKLAASLDGKTALQNGKSQWITSPLARRDVQRHRARSCAILSGSGTVMADNPSLNVRYNELQGLNNIPEPDQQRQPLRVLLDGRNQLPNDLQLLNLAGQILLINCQQSGLSFPANVTQWQAPSLDKKLDLHAVMQHLGSLGMNEIWVEAGAKLAGALLQEKLIDQLILYQAPKLIGDKGQSLFSTLALEEMSQVNKLKWQDIRQVGEDLKLTADLQYSE